MLTHLYCREWIRLARLRRLPRESPIRPQSSLYFVGTRVGLGQPLLQASMDFVTGTTHRYLGGAPK